MATYNIEISEPAENDLRDMIHYISSQLSSLMTTTNMMDIIEEGLLGLADLPQKCPAVRDDRLAAMGYRKLLIKNNVAFFTIVEHSKVVNIERILYARRDWLRIL
ncbi:type II toxin-antitoxin system RelE/ParE family toxin [Acetobacterium sp. UBA5834]|jgi:plasmid stabilization system protein ParE|uniref:type II toxin-antitoxin system RelE/ParE family toxin n=1 Tax=Acetobacterium sp. UBA5834 TaxID=1945907 RepID=UPI0025795C6C|nr:type II toxin-antitoxin system RelE/ParE family toxin [Acetobacterium sp. UBA5834]